MQHFFLKVVPFKISNLFSYAFNIFKLYSLLLDLEKMNISCYKKDTYLHNYITFMPSCITNIGNLEIQRRDFENKILYIRKFDSSNQNDFIFDILWYYENEQIL